MTTSQTDTLISLNETDKILQTKVKKLKALELKSITLEKNISVSKANIEKLKVINHNAQKIRLAEQEKLDQEQLKISERRKQLSSIGGAKSAKLVEREMGIVKRAIETLEQNVLSALESEENTEKKLTLAQDSLVALESELKTFESQYQTNSEKLKLEIKDLEQKRLTKLKMLDERVATLYTRVETKYKGDAVALADNGSCRSCFRALPPQTYNQVIAGYNLLQCPGCSRILAYVAPVKAEEIETKKEEQVVETSAQ